MSGIVASQAGANSASPIPNGITRTTTCQSSISPVTESRPMPASDPARMKSATISRRRRGIRSARTPPKSRNPTIGSVQARPTSESAVGTLERS